MQAAADASYVVYTMAATTDGGFFTEPIALPLDCDVSYPIDLWVVLRNQLLNANPGTQLLLETFIRWVTPPGLINSRNLQMGWVPPTAWPQSDYQRVKLVHDTAPDDENTIPAHTFDPATHFGVRLMRLGANAGDTYPNGVQAGASLEMQYHRRCQAGCC